LSWTVPVLFPCLDVLAGALPTTLLPATAAPRLDPPSCPAPLTPSTAPAAARLDTGHAEA